MKLKCIIPLPNLRPEFWRLPNLCKVSPQRNSLIKLIHYDVTKKALDSQIIVRAKEKLSQDGPSQGQALGINKRVKDRRSEVCTTVVQSKKKP